VGTQLEPGSVVGAVVSRRGKELSWSRRGEQSWSGWSTTGSVSPGQPLVRLYPEEFPRSVPIKPRTGFAYARPRVRRLPPGRVVTNGDLPEHRLQRRVDPGQVGHRDQALGERRGDRPGDVGGAAARRWPTPGPSDQIGAVIVSTVCTSTRLRPSPLRSPRSSAPKALPRSTISAACAGFCYGVGLADGWSGPARPSTSSSSASSGCPTLPTAMTARPRSCSRTGPARPWSAHPTNPASPGHLGLRRYSGGADQPGGKLAPGVPRRQRRG
jgi:hypothetical protein